MEKKSENCSSRAKTAEPDCNNDHEYKLIALDSDSSVLDSVVKLISDAFETGEQFE